MQGIVLIQFVFRATFGIALCMAITPSKRVSSGFYRVHLWVLMGANTFAALIAYSQRETLREQISFGNTVLGFAVSVAVLSYVGSVLWLYEKRQAGSLALFLVTAGGLLAAALATPWPESTSGTGIALAFLDLASGGLLLGVTLSAMFLGHWYLNTPTMELLPLKRLVLLMTIAVVIRTVVSGAGLVLHLQAKGNPEAVFWIIVSLRWLTGLLGNLCLALMTWYTLKIPNTQSATGILYAGVILTFIGELTSQFMSLETLYPI